jgi:ribonuclease Z
VQAGTSGAAVEALFITHLHSDHIMDLFQLVISSWHQGRARPWVIHGPPGTRAYVDGLMALWRPELEQRIAHERRPSTTGLKVEVREFAAGPIHQEGAILVTAVAVDHAPIRHAFGFVVEGEGARIVLSGDTRYSPALIAAARGADLLVHEVFIHRAMPVVPGVRSAETVASVMAYHTPSDQVGKVAAAGARTLVLTHYVPTRFDGAALRAEVARDFPGRLILGEDLMRIDPVHGVVPA